ncbi:MAG: tRNA (adenosine(37)-N6)-threonylcarbamoyltransferase complex ATPase subunit type 1 TsaE [Clostridiales bacterium]|nr:tRNA (adenosine(37)-N6)-threonylcarbamoyltransferase complex ATPase subunit type 1 TsaE [Clostridiales bacterium]
MKTVCKHEKETVALGEKIGRSLKGGELITLSGDLGAGKTTFTKGIAYGMGVAVPVVSPTFTLMNEYEGNKLFLRHFDMYRLHSAEEAYEAGLTEYFGKNDGVCVLEWAENISPALDGYRVLRINIYYENENTRVVEILEQ